MLAINFDVKPLGWLTLAGARNRITQLNHTDWKNVIFKSKESSSVENRNDVLYCRSRTSFSWWTKKISNVLNRSDVLNFSTFYFLENKFIWNSYSFLNRHTWRISSQVNRFWKYSNRKTTTATPWRVTKRIRIHIR